MMMFMAANLRLTAAAAAELGRQAAVAGTPGLMHLDLTGNLPRLQTGRCISIILVRV